MTLSIQPLGAVPVVRDVCIAWADAEWGEVAGFTLADWDVEFGRIKAHPIDDIFVAFEQDNPIGMVWILEHEGIETHTHLTPWLSCLVVDPDHRGKGVGAALIAHCEAHAAAGGGNILYLLTETPSVYFTHGWEVADTATLGDRDVFVMQKDIASSAARSPG